MYIESHFILDSIKNRRKRNCHNAYAQAIFLVWHLLTALAYIINFRQKTQHT